MSDLEKNGRRKKTELPESIKEGVLLQHLIQKDHRKLEAIAEKLGVEKTYLSNKKLSNVGVLSSKVATAATRLWGLSPDYFERCIKDEAMIQQEKTLQQTLDEINSGIKELLTIMKSPSSK